MRVSHFPQNASGAHNFALHSEVPIFNFGAWKVLSLTSPFHLLNITRQERFKIYLGTALHTQNTLERFKYP